MGVAITFFNQWKSKGTEFDIISIEYRQDYDEDRGIIDNMIILGFLGFGCVLLNNMEYETL